MGEVIVGTDFFSIVQAPLIVCGLLSFVCCAGLLIRYGLLRNGHLTHLSLRCFSLRCFSWLLSWLGLAHFSLPRSLYLAPISRAYRRPASSARACTIISLSDRYKPLVQPDSLYEGLRVQTAAKLQTAKKDLSKKGLSKKGLAQKGLAKESWQDFVAEKGGQGPRNLLDGSDLLPSPKQQNHLRRQDRLGADLETASPTDRWSIEPLEPELVDGTIELNKALENAYILVTELQKNAQSVTDAPDKGTLARVGEKSVQEEPLPKDHVSHSMRPKKSKRLAQHLTAATLDFSIIKPQMHKNMVLNDCEKNPSSVQQQMDAPAVSNLRDRRAFKRYVPRQHRIERTNQSAEQLLQSSLDRMRSISQNQDRDLGHRNLGHLACFSNAKSPFNSSCHNTATPSDRLSCGPTSPTSPTNMYSKDLYSGAKTKLAHQLNPSARGVAPDHVMCSKARPGRATAIQMHGRATSSTQRKQSVKAMKTSRNEKSGTTLLAKIFAKSISQFSGCEKKPKTPQPPPIDFERAQRGLELAKTLSKRNAHKRVRRTYKATSTPERLNKIRTCFAGGKHFEKSPLEEATKN